MPAWYPNNARGMRFTQKPVDPKAVQPLPSMDLRSYYDAPSPSSSSSGSSSDSDLPAAVNLPTNSGNKHVLSARFTRRGKIYAWAPSYEDVRSDYRARKRMKTCLETFLPDAAADVGVPVPENIVTAETKREKRKRKREEEADWLLPHLRSPSPPLSTGKLAPTLALPSSYTDIVLSPAMRHSLGDDTVENGLQRTTQELLEGEKGLMQACGRLQEILRLRNRDVPKAKATELANGDHSAPNGHAEGQATDQPTENGTSTSTPNGQPSTERSRLDMIPPLPHISDTDNLWRVTQELLLAHPPPTIEYSSTAPGDALRPTATSHPPEPSEPLIVTPIHRLFTCPDGLTVSAVPNMSHPLHNIPGRHTAGRPRVTRYNLDMRAQCRAVDDALERVAELLADCMEYKERLEEARDRIADVARARKRVWGVIKERAGAELDRQ